jgi:hypothetical protein
MLIERTERGKTTPIKPRCTAERYVRMDPK